MWTISLYRSILTICLFKPREGNCDQGGGGAILFFVCNIFCIDLWQASEDLENMETLAQMAASHNEVNASDGEAYIEKYIKGVSAVESILTLDRLRQVR